MEQSNYRTGLIRCLCANTLWGLLPIYWNALKPIDSFTIMTYRVLLMAIVCFLITMYINKGIKGMFAPLFESRKTFFMFVMAGIVITINWSIYIFAVNAGFVIQSSMGYFMEPLVVCVFGMIFYKERANKYKKIAIGLATFALLFLVVGYGEIPIIAVSLGISFAIYSAFKKSVFLNPFQSMLYETMFLAPIALIIILISESAGTGALSVNDMGKYALLMLAGICTATPLGLFSSAANKLPLITVGLLEYISPSISLVLGIFLFNEPFDKIQFTAFAIIWIGIVFFTIGEVKEAKLVTESESTTKTTD